MLSLVMRCFITTNCLLMFMHIRLMYAPIPGKVYLLTYLHKYYNANRRQVELSCVALYRALDL